MIRTAPFSLLFLQDLPGLWGNRLSHIGATPFDIDELQKRVLQATKDKKKGKPAFYIDARSLDHRLNLMLGRSWAVSFRSQVCGDQLVVHAALNIGGVVREDLSAAALKNYKGEVDELAATVAQAAAYKRAAVKFGISAYLYDFKDEVIWLPLNPDYPSQFQNPDIKLEDLPTFARPISGNQLVMDELKYLCNSSDGETLKTTLKTYWGLESFKDLDRDDSIRLASSIGRISDYIDYTGSNLEDLKKEQAEARAKKEQTRGMGFSRHA